MKQVTFNNFGWTLTFKVYKDRRGLVSALIRNECPKEWGAACLSTYWHNANILKVELLFEEGHLGSGIVSHEMFHAVCRHMEAEIGVGWLETHEEEAAELMSQFTRRFWDWWLD